MSKPLPLIRGTFCRLMFAMSMIAMASSSAGAQDLTPASEPPSTEAAPEQPGIIGEPEIIRRVVVTLDRRFNSGEATDGLYAVYGKMIPGSGWISGGPGYRRWYSQDRMFVDTSAQLSWRGYTAAQARLELTRLARSRLQVGAQARWQDFKQVSYFGQGPTSLASNRSQYRVQSRIVGGYATIRPLRTVAIDMQLGYLRPTILAPSGAFQRGLLNARDVFSADPVYSLAEQPSFLHQELSITS